MSIRRMTMKQAILKRKFYTSKSSDTNDRCIPPPKFPIPKEWKDEGYEEKLYIHPDSTFTREYNKRKDFKIFRDEVKIVQKDFKEGAIYEDGNGRKTRTHYYPEESTKYRLYCSKDINGSDRLMYEIFAPKLEEIDGKLVIVTEVILRFCSGHTHKNGKKFSEI